MRYPFLQRGQVYSLWVSSRTLPFAVGTGGIISSLGRCDIATLALEPCDVFANFDSPVPDALPLEGEIFSV